MLLKRHNQDGFALLLAVIIAAIVLAIGLTMLNVTLKQLTLSATTRESEAAFNAASAGMDCIRYWRHILADNYTDTIAAGTAPTIGCFTPSTINTQTQTVVHTNGPSYTNGFLYQIDWGTGVDARCTEIELYTMVASTSPYAVNFSYGAGGLSVTESVGSGGVKTCDIFNLCTVAISRGYNRACADLSVSSLITVEREIVSEF